MKDPFHKNDDDDVIDLDSKFDMKNFQSKGKKIIISVVIVLILVIAAFQSIYVLDSKDAAVVLRLGKVHQIQRDAGLHLKIPFIDSARVVNVEQVYEMEYGYRTLRSGTEQAEPDAQADEQEATVIVDGANNNASIALIELMVQYRIGDPEQYLFEVDDVEGTLRLALEDVLRSTVQAFTLDDARKNKELIDQQILPALQRKINLYHTGLDIVQLKTQNVSLLPSVQEAYQEKENANQYKNGKLEEALKYSNTIIPQAEAEAQQLIEDANGYRAEVIADANANVAQFNALYDEYVQNPDIVKEKYYIEAMQEFLQNNDIVINNTDDQTYFFYNGNPGDVVKQQIVQGEGDAND